MRGSAPALMCLARVSCRSFKTVQTRAPQGFLRVRAGGLCRPTRIRALPRPFSRPSSCRNVLSSLIARNPSYVNY